MKRATSPAVIVVSPSSLKSMELLFTRTNSMEVAARSWQSNLPDFLLLVGGSKAVRLSSASVEKEWIRQNVEHPPECIKTKE